MKYVRCDSHCKYPAYDQEEIDNLFYNKTQMNATLSKMHNDLVKPDEVYLKDEYAVLTGEIVMTSGTGSATVDYPTGFTQDNCVVLSYGQRVGTGSVYFGYGIKSTDYMSGSLTRNVALTSSNIVINVYNPASEGNGDKTYTYKIVLMKIA